MIEILERIYNQIQSGNKFAGRDIETGLMITKITQDILNRPQLDPEAIKIGELILKISNILYNETSDEVLPLDDGLYDRLVIKMQPYKVVVGAVPLDSFTESAPNEVVQITEMCHTIDHNKANKTLYANDLLKQNTPLSQMRLIEMCHVVQPMIKKRLINVPHKYPQLVGTLDKCKCTLNEQAKALGSYDDPSFTIFERDFIHKIMDRGVITPNEEFTMVAELKYDGVSVEATVRGNKIISALSRGDTADNIATDLTPILGGYQFPNAGEVSKDEEFGIKFEAVITKYDLQRLSELRGKSYKNGRNAIIGLFGASDAWRYKSFITLIPIATSLDIPRLTELAFLNKYYNSGYYNKHCVLTGNYQQILFQVKQFVDSAEVIRPVLPYMIDGVVLSFIDPAIIQILGRENSVNKYQMAIKFIPRNARTVFMGYTYNVGKTGEIIPMAHFKPCEFIGTIHDKQTIHSLQRFNELKLRFGDIIDIEYRNEVITYVTKPDVEQNRNNTSPVIPFPTHCPCCGTELVISESGKSAKCPNPKCKDRLKYQITSSLNTLGITDFSDASVEKLGLYDLFDVLRVDHDYMFSRGFGETETENYLRQVRALEKSIIPDYKLMTALNFEGIADNTWKTILRYYTIDELISMGSNITEALSNINGIGKAKSEVIYSGFVSNIQLLSKMLRYFNISNYKDNYVELPKVVITGTRDQALVDKLQANSYDAVFTSVTKNTFAVIAADPNSKSGKVSKANSMNIPVYGIQEFIQKYC